MPSNRADHRSGQVAGACRNFALRVRPRQIALKKPCHLPLKVTGIRDNGDVRTGATVSGQVRAVFEFKEPRPEGLPEWLDLSVPDDQLVAAALLLQSEHPGSALYIATGDLNMQTKLAAVGLPYIEAT